MSKQVSNNPRRFIPALRSTNKDYVSLQTLAVRIVSFMTAAVAIYATPNPALASVTAQVSALKSAIGSGGSKWNRGSKASIELIRAEAESLRALIIALIAYAVNTTVTSDSQQTQSLYNYLLSGLSRKRPPIASNKSLDNIRGFKISRVGANFESIRFQWKKPKGMIKGKPANLYIISVQDENGIWQKQGQVTKTSFDINSGSPLFDGATTFLRIQPFSSTGEGQPYTFRVSNTATTPPSPVTLQGDLGATNSTNINYQLQSPLFTNIELAAVTTEMRFYFGAVAGAQPDPDRPTFGVSAGGMSVFTIAQLKINLEYDLAHPWLNVKNVGDETGHWAATLS